MNRLRKLYYIFKFYLIFNSNKSVIVKSTSPRCFIFLAADYGNLGDIAITYAQKEFLTDKFPSHKIIEVPASATLNAIKNLKGSINPEDIITVVGGGNMCDLYGDIELLRLLIVEAFPKNRIILFPQTIDYSNTKGAKWLLNESRKIYQKHPNLTMCAREAISAKSMRHFYPTIDVRLTPDIVMSLDMHTKEKREDIVTFCLRSDKEKQENSEIISKIKLFCKNSGLRFEFHDTHIGNGRFSEEEKYLQLGKLFKQFSRSRLIVTDRLHGMIFAFITRTPAIVIPNSNFKIRGCFQWIKDCGYILYISTLSDIETIGSVLEAETDNSIIQIKLKELLNDIV